MTDARAKEYSKRDEYLFEVIRQLSDLKVGEITINIITKSNNIKSKFDKIMNSINIKYHVYSAYNKINVIHNSPWNYNNKSPWLLTWEHKKLILQDINHATYNSLFCT